MQRDFFLILARLNIRAGSADEPGVRSIIAIAVLVCCLSCSKERDGAGSTREIAEVALDSAVRRNPAPLFKLVHAGALSRSFLDRARKEIEGEWTKSKAPQVRVEVERTPLPEIEASLPNSGGTTHSWPIPPTHQLRIHFASPTRSNTLHTVTYRYPVARKGDRWYIVAPKPGPPPKPDPHPGPVAPVSLLNP